MKKIIFCNSLKKICTVLNNQEDFCYVLITYNRDTITLRNFLREKNYREIILKDFSEYIHQYLNNFVEFVGNLNVNNHYLPFWWTLNFTNKNPITTALCNKVFYFLLIIEIIKNIDFKNLLVICDDIDLVKQFIIWASDKNIKIINVIKKRRSLKDIIKTYTPFAIIFAFLRSFLFKLYAISYCKYYYAKNKNYTIVLSLLNHQSFNKDGYYRDAYFGDFVNYLNERNSYFINLVIVITPFYKEILNKVYSQKNKVPLLTIEYFLSNFDLLLCLFNSLKRYFSPIKLKGNTKIKDINLRYLVKQIIRNDYISSYFYDNLKIYYAIKSISKIIAVNNFYYPFENRSFEKMIILALRRFSPKTKIIGYQHASLSLRHTNFLLTKEEAKITPLPDIIITMGEITKEIMESIGNFPKEILRVGCALRQSVYKGTLKNKPKKIINVFVALATGIEEYVKVLNFLNLAFMNNNIYNLWIRPHPVFSLEEAINLLGDFNLKFHKADKETLEECFTFSDIVLYVHSTLSLEALLRGIPLINIDIGEPINPDPLFNFEDFKWKVDKPENLIPTMQYIDSLNEASFRLGQEKGRIFAQRYIYEVTKERLEDFISV